LENNNLCPEKKMSQHKIFIDRRLRNDRREDIDPCKDLPVDIYHRRRRKSVERRFPERTLIDDYKIYLADLENKSIH
jgi:hypothetical protein